VRQFSTFFCLFTAFTAVSFAGITASLDGGAPAAIGGGNYRYTYTAVLDNHVLEAGDYFVIYDFLGYQAGSITAPNVDWMTDDSGTVGPYPAAPINENAAVVNLLWVYEGANISAAGGPVVLGKFSADSSLNRVGALSFGGVTDGGNTDFSGTAGGPIPEPATTGLLTAALGAMWYARRRWSH
jgi:hypothetical protein